MKILIFLAGIIFTMVFEVIAFTIYYCYTYYKISTEQDHDLNKYI